MRRTRRFPWCPSVSSRISGKCSIRRTSSSATWALTRCGRPGLYQAERPNTCIISNGFASMGIGVPGAIAAKLAHPERTAVTITGDAGFLMNCQEIETALRIGTPIILLIWDDSEYGLIHWHQLRHFGRPSHIDFNNPDFVMFAESFGAQRLSSRNRRRVGADA